MSFIDAILGVMGFETEDKPKKKKVVKQKSSRASFVLSDEKENQPKPLQREEIKPERQFQPRTKIVELRPLSQQEVMSAIDLVRSGAKVILDISAFQNDINRVLDFLSGACYCLNAKIERMPDGRYMICVNR